MLFLVPKGEKNPKQTNQENPKPHLTTLIFKKTECHCLPVTDLVRPVERVRAVM